LNQKVNTMSNKQRGFTLIELVMVIVILGILAAVALPKFVNLAGDAGDASASGVAGALSSATAINYSKYQISSGAATAITSGTTTCAGLTDLLTGQALPSNVSYVNSGQAITCANPAGAGGVSTTNCYVKHASGNTSAGFAVSAICTN
jgi:MSHA pilin protein MshA